jgi:hypothetical protein
LAKKFLIQAELHKKLQKLKSFAENFTFSFIEMAMRCGLQRRTVLQIVISNPHTHCILNTFNVKEASISNLGLIPCGFL